MMNISPVIGSLVPRPLQSGINPVFRGRVRVHRPKDAPHGRCPECRGKRSAGNRCLRRSCGAFMQVFSLD